MIGDGFNTACLRNIRRQVRPDNQSQRIVSCRTSPVKLRHLRLSPSRHWPRPGHINLGHDTGIGNNSA